MIPPRSAQIGGREACDHVDVEGKEMNDCQIRSSVWPARKLMGALRPRSKALTIYPRRNHTKISPLPGKGLIIQDDTCAPSSLVFSSSWRSATPCANLHISTVKYLPKFPPVIEQAV